MDFLQRSLAIGLGLVMGLSAFGVQAQEQELVFEEIIVTAQKREQSLQDVPISVSVVSGEKLTEAGIFTLDDLAHGRHQADPAQAPHVFGYGPERALPRPMLTTGQ